MNSILCDLRALKKLIIRWSSNHYIKNTIMEQTKSFEIKDAWGRTTIKLTKHGSVRWTFICGSRQFFMEFTNENIPKNIGGMENFYKIICDAHDNANVTYYNPDYKRYKSTDNTQMFVCYCDASCLRMSVDINYVKTLKFNFNVHLQLVYSIPPEIEYPIFIAYDVKLYDLMETIIGRDKLECGADKFHVYCGCGYCKCNNLNELQTHFNIFQKVNPNFTYDNFKKSNFNRHMELCVCKYFDLPENNLQKVFMFDSVGTQKDRIIYNALVAGLTPLAADKIITAK